MGTKYDIEKNSEIKIQKTKKSLVKFQQIHRKLHINLLLKMKEPHNKGMNNQYKQVANVKLSIFHIHNSEIW